jgi:hypothetical protein
MSLDAPTDLIITVLTGVKEMGCIGQSECWSRTPSSTLAPGPFMETLQRSRTTSSRTKRLGSKRLLYGR